MRGGNGNEKGTGEAGEVKGGKANKGKTVMVFSDGSVCKGSVGCGA